MVAGGTRDPRQVRARRRTTPGVEPFRPPVPVLHVYAQPRAPEYLAVQEAFAREHPWYFVHRLEGVSQFPTLEVPDETAAVIREFIR